MIREATLFVFSPLLSLVEPHYQSLHAFVAAPKTHRFVLKSLVFAALFALLFIGAVLAYAAFYTFYVPQVGFVQDVPLRYVPTNPSDPRSPLVPSGHVVLDAPGLPTSLLSPGQPYDLTLVLRVPNSPHNYAQGTFTAAVTLTNGDGVLAKGAGATPTPLYYAAKPVALRWTSPLLAWMDTLAFAFPLVLGYASEQQTVNVRLIEGVVSPAPLPPVLPGIDRDLAGAVEPATGASALWNMAATVAGSVVGADAANGGGKDGEPAVVAPADTPIPAASMKAYATMLAQWRFQHASQQATSPASPLAVPQPPLRSTFYPVPSDTEAEPVSVVPSRALAQAHVALSAPVHVYAATLRVDAQFYGLRYLMYYWFFTSASIGVGILMVWEVIIGLAVWRVVIGKKITVEVIDEEDEEEEESELEGSDVDGTDVEGSVTGDESGSELASLEGSDASASASGSEEGSDDDDRSSTSSSSGAESESDHEDDHQAAAQHPHQRHHRRHHHRRGLDANEDDEVDVPEPAPAPAPTASPNPAPTAARRRTDEEDATILASRANTAARATATGVAARGNAELRQRRAPAAAGSADLLAETTPAAASGAPGSASSGEESVVKVEKRDAEGA
ncbi:Berardinelli-Seip congenital lipodystrophy 2 (seipin) [Allomyces javanicus]|nr:Berardinelli-Seip congenital lipodystrophy 2 (seipin) [Allomyces javanicus]